MRDGSSPGRWFQPVRMIAGIAGVCVIGLAVAFFLFMMPRIFVRFTPVLWWVGPPGNDGASDWWRGGVETERAVRQYPSEINRMRMDAGRAMARHHLREASERHFLTPNGKAVLGLERSNYEYLRRLGCVNAPSIDLEFTFMECPGVAGERYVALATKPVSSRSPDVITSVYLAVPVDAGGPVWGNDTEQP